MIKNVIFDLDGVIRGIKDVPINDILPSKFKKYSELYKGKGLCDFVAKYLPMPCFKEWDKGTVNQEDVLQEVLKATDEPSEVVEFLFKSAMDVKLNFVYIETLDLIKRLKNENYNIFLLSNMSKEIVNNLTCILDFSIFDDCVFSCDVGLRKPDIEFYKIAINKWKIKAKNSIFIDDNNKNLVPFENLGGKTYCFNPKEIRKNVEEVYKIIHN